MLTLYFSIAFDHAVKMFTGFVLAFQLPTEYREKAAQIPFPIAKAVLVTKTIMCQITRQCL